MLRDLSFSETQFLVIVFGVIFGIALLITISRWYYSGKFNHLSKRKKEKTILTARNKYQEVDVFKNSNRYLGIGLVAALIFTVAAFNWTSVEKQKTDTSYTL